jgi:hypothetical protein
MEAFQVINHMGNPIDYRPSVQHHLFKRDECFDFRLGAINRVKFHYLGLYREVIKLTHQELFREIKKYVQSNNEDSETIQLLSLKTLLSDADSKEMITSLEQHFENEVVDYQQSFFVSYHYNDYKSTSVHEIVGDIFAIIIKKFQSRDSKKRSMWQDPNEFESPSNKKILWGFLKLHASMGKDADITEDSFPYQSLVIAINNFDAIDVTVAGGMIRALVGYDVKVFIIAVSKVYTQCLSRMDESVTRIIKIEEYRTTTPIELSDRFNHLLFTLPKLGPVIPISLIQQLHAAFLSMHMCVYSLLQA